MDSMLLEKTFYYYRHTGESWNIRDSFFLDKKTEYAECLTDFTDAQPVIWINDGLYGLISADKISNIIASLKDQEKLPVLDRKKEVGVIHWDEVEIIPSKIAKLLFGE